MVSKEATMSGVFEFGDVINDMREGVSQDDKSVLNEYAGDPYWINAKYSGKDHNGLPFKKGDRVLYYPKTRTFYQGEEAESAWRDFRSAAGDEAGCPYGEATGQFGVTKGETVHGNPGEQRTLPAGIRVRLLPAKNLPSGSDIKWWAYPVQQNEWPEDTEEWARNVGVGLGDDDVELGTTATSTQEPVKEAENQQQWVISHELFGDGFRTFVSKEEAEAFVRTEIPRIVRDWFGAGTGKSIVQYGVYRGRSADELTTTLTAEVLGRIEPLSSSTGAAKESVRVIRVRMPKLVEETEPGGTSADWMMSLTVTELFNDTVDRVDGSLHAPNGDVSPGANFLTEVLTITVEELNYHLEEIWDDGVFNASEFTRVASEVQDHVQTTVMPDTPKDVWAVFSDLGAYAVNTDGPYDDLVEGGRAALSEIISAEVAALLHRYEEWADEYTRETSGSVDDETALDADSDDEEAQ
jgi:hypothetical protein